MQAHHAHAFGGDAVARGDHSAFAGGKRLGRIKAEAGEFAHRADAPRFINPMEARGRRLRSHANCGGKRSPRIASISQGWPPRCTGITARVFGVIRRAKSSGSRFIVAGSISAKTGRAPVYPIGFGRRGKRVCRNDHLVPRANSGGDQRKMQRRGAGTDCNGVPRAHVLSKSHARNAAVSRAHRQPSAANHFRDSAHFFFAERGAMKRDRSAIAFDLHRLRIHPR